MFLNEKVSLKEKLVICAVEKNEENIKSNYMKPTEIFASYIEMGTESET